MAAEQISHAAGATSSGRNWPDGESVHWIEEASGLLRVPEKPGQVSDQTQDQTTDQAADDPFAAPLDQLPEEEVRGTGFEREDRRIVPRRLILLCAAGLSVFLALALFRCDSSDAGRVRVDGLSPSPGRAAQIGTETSETYRDNLRAYSEEKARTALKSGDSFVAPAEGARRPRPVPREEATQSGEAKAEAPAPGPARTTKALRSDKPKVHAPEPQTRVNDPRVSDYLRQLARPKSAARGSVIVFNAPSALAAPDAVFVAVSAIPDMEKPALRVGDMLYAVNRVSLDSDAPGPAMAEVIAGDLRGARVVGGFTRQGEHLVLKFTELVTPSGRSRAIQGYAVDPETDRTAVSSAVDRHSIERWGGLVAASFLEGFGRATERSGSSAWSSSYGSGWAAPDYSPGDEAWIAAGKVGERLANQVEKHFDRAPTVTLRSGVELGILIVRVGESKDAVRKDRSGEAPVSRIRPSRAADRDPGANEPDTAYKP